MNSVRETLSRFRGLDPVATVPRWERLIERRTKGASTPNPRFIHEPWSVFSGEGNYITIDQRESDSGLTVVFFTSYFLGGVDHSQSAVVLQKGEPVKLVSQYTTDHDRWDVSDDNLSTRKIIRDKYTTLRGASLFTSKRGKWHGLFPNLDGVKFALEE